MAIEHHFHIRQGEALPNPFNPSIFRWRDMDKNPVNLTGYRARMQLRPKVKSDTVLDTLTTENGRIVLDPLMGEITLIFPEDFSVDATWKGAVYDLELVPPVGGPFPLAYGTFSITREVTRVQ